MHDKQGRTVLLLLGIVSSHFPNIELQSVCLHYLPPNTTSHLQPLDAGIIKSFKSWCRKFQVEDLIQKLERELPADINLKEAIRFLSRAWKSGTPETVSNCWKHTGIVTSATSEKSILDTTSQLSSLLAAHHP